MPREVREDAPRVTRSAPRKRVSSPTTASRSVTRKAPTRTMPTSTARTSSMKMLIAIIAGYITVCGASVAIGMTDPGQIDVSATITQRTATERRLAEERGEEYVPPQATADTQARTPNGGLRPQGLVASPEPPQVPPPAPTEATSTESEAADAAESTITDETSSSESSPTDESPVDVEESTAATSTIE